MGVEDMATSEPSITHLVRFDADSAPAFKHAYEEARDAGAEQFSFAGGDWLVSYARYVCEYLKERGLL
jgi:hypothetical protein